MHPLLSPINRLGLYLLAWVPLTAILVYLMAAPAGLGWWAATFLVVPLCRRRRHHRERDVLRMSVGDVLHAYDFADRGERRHPRRLVLFAALRELRFDDRVQREMRPDDTPLPVSRA